MRILDSTNAEIIRANSESNGGNAEWREILFNFTTPADDAVRRGQLWLVFDNGGSVVDPVPDGTPMAWFDDVSLVEVPEPAAAMLLLSAAGMIVGRRHRSN